MTDRLEEIRARTREMSHRIPISSNGDPVAITYLRDIPYLLDRLERAEARAAKWHAVAREAIAWFEEAREYADTLVTEMRGYDETSARFAATLAALETGEPHE